MPASRCARCRWTPSRPLAARYAAAWQRSTEPPRQLNAEARKNEKLRPVHRPLSRIIVPPDHHKRSEEHTSELQSLMRISYAVFCLKTKTHHPTITKQARVRLTRKT